MADSASPPPINAGALTPASPAPAGPIAAIVFDFDGVILESADVKTDAFLELYAGHGPAVVEQVRAHHLSNLGISRFKKFAWIAEHVLHQPFSDADSQQLGQRFAELALAKVLAAPFVPGAEPAQAQLAVRGTPMYVASGTPDDELNLIVSRRGLAGRFRGVHGTPREKPDIMAGIARSLRVKPDRLLFIGDGMSDYVAACAAHSQFLARDTPALHDQWRTLDVRLEPDLHRLPEIVAAW